MDNNEESEYQAPQLVNRLVYVSSITNQPKAVVKTLAQLIGISQATQRVEHWFNNYTELIFDQETGDPVMIKKRTNGYWEPVGNALSAWQHKD